VGRRVDKRGRYGPIAVVALLAVFATAGWLRLGILFPLTPSFAQNVSEMPKCIPGYSELPEIALPSLPIEFVFDSTSIYLDPMRIRVDSQ
jgi:hypothetical protein